MQAKYRISRPARRDLDEIWDEIFIHSQSTDVADKVLRKFFETFDLLGDQPGIGHRREDLTDRNLKFWTLYQYLVAYVPDSSPLEIVAVIHGARNVATLLDLP